MASTVVYTCASGLVCLCLCTCYVSFLASLIRFNDSQTGDKQWLNQHSCSWKIWNQLESLGLSWNIVASDTQLHTQQGYIWPQLHSQVKGHYLLPNRPLGRGGNQTYSLSIEYSQTVNITNLVIRNWQSYVSITGPYYMHTHMWRKRIPILSITIIDMSFLATWQHAQ